jgi:hypothetical protein
MIFEGKKKKRKEIEGIAPKVEGKWQCRGTTLILLSYGK